MANFHVVPKGDAIKHETRGRVCRCGVHTKTVCNDDTRGGYDVWFYHRHVSIEEAVMSDEPHAVGAA